MSVTVLHGDCRALLPTLAAESVDCCITSPPYYNLRDYGCDGQAGLEATPEAYVENLVAVFAEVHRALKPTGTLWLNLGDSYARDGAKGQHRPGQNGKQAAAYDRGAGRSSSCLVRDVQGNSMVSSHLKQKDLIGIPWRVALALQADGWYLRSDIIWCLSGGARVYARTQKGDMPLTVKDLVRLRPETVKLWNGEKWTQVLGWSETPRPESALEIELRSGERIGCTVGHEWPTQRGNVAAEDLVLGDVIQTCRLPSDVSRSPFSLSDVGWFIGLYLAEGSRSGNTIQISGHRREKSRFTRLKKIAADYDGTCRWHETGGEKAVVHLRGPVLEGILATYLAGRVACDKHLNIRCWQRTDEFLFAILSGYLEGDGHYEAKNGRWRIGFCNNGNLANDIRTLCARLGLSLRLRPCVHRCNGSDHPGYRGEIRFNRSGHHNQKDNGEVVAIRKSRARKFWDIGVADEPHLFALASGVLTHNSKGNAMPESVRDRPARSHEYLFLLAKNERYYYDHVAVREPGVYPAGTRGAKGSAARQAEKGVNARPPEYKVYDGWRNKRTVWEINTKPFSGAHFAVMPAALVEPCVLAGSSERGCCVNCGIPWRRRVEAGEPVKVQNGGPKTQTKALVAKGKHGETSVFHTGQMCPPVTVGWEPGCRCGREDTVPAVILDPFAGSGTVGEVALKHGRSAVLIELNEAYLPFIHARTQQESFIL